MKPEKTSTLRLVGLATIASAALLVACGGGQSPSDAQPTLSGTLIDGPIQGARVFLDLNGNLEHDSNEPISAETDAAGAFSLKTGELTSSQVTNAMLVSKIPSSARDADDGGLTIAEAGKQPFTLVSPANAFMEVVAGKTDIRKPAVVSPLTTLVAGEMLDNGRRLDEARTFVKDSHALPRDPLDDFISVRDAATARVARAVAVALGEAGRSVGEVSVVEGGIAAREQMRAVVQTVRESLPAVVAELGLSNSTAADPSVGDLVRALADKQLATRAADRMAVRVTGRPAAPSTGSGGGAGAPDFHDYIVVFKTGAGQREREDSSADAVRSGGTILHTYTRALNGFAVRLPAMAGEAFLNAMANNPNVDYVETDAPVSTRQQVQESAPWALDRVDQRSRTLDGVYTYATAGSGVRAYVVDSGILSNHVEFGARVVPGYGALSDGRGTEDCNGHGTHVAGLIGSATYGVAKSVSLVPVRVLDCAGSGTLSGVIAGIDWVIGDPGRNGPALINLSLGGGASASLDAAVAKAVATGIPVVVAAGNDNANACNYSPARESSAITVGATTNTDARASYSNFGSCLDLFAPGSAITSTWYESTVAVKSLNGTSMAAPHVAGLVALILGSSADATPADIPDLIRAAATTGVVTSAGSGSPNLLLYTLTDSVVTTPPSPSLTASVATLSSHASSLRNGWQATVTIAVKDASGSLVAGAKVSGGFKAGGSSVSCTTASNGMCSVRTGTLGKRVDQTTYSVSGITGTGMTYDPSRDVTRSLTVRRP